MSAASGAVSVGARATDREVDMQSVTGEALARRYEIEGGGGLKLDACEWGDPRGPALLLIHGWSPSRLCWGPQVESHLADTLRRRAFDNRGHGMSDKPLTPDRYVEGRLWADDVA